MSVTQLDAPPNLSRLYARAALSSVRPGGGSSLPDTELVLGDVTFEREHLAAYDRICGFRLRDALPATYPHVVAFPMAVQLMASPSFPFPMVGLVHVRNRIEQHRPLLADETPTFRVHAENLRDHSKGRLFDIVASAEVGGEEVWRDVSTYLRRGGGSDDAAKATPVASVEPDLAAPEALWRVPGDIGRRYAAASGDRNPIHLYPLTAKLFGFPRNIAHGMWTKARCLAALEGRVPEAFTVEAAFKAPLVVPSTVVFTSQPRAGGWQFALHGARKGRPHLQGALTPR